MIIWRISLLASPRTASSAWMCSSLWRDLSVTVCQFMALELGMLHTSRGLLGQKEALRRQPCQTMCECVYLMSGYLDTSVVTSRNSSVGSVSLKTSAMAAMAPQSRSVSSPYSE
ncbi:hypothetical protein EYF80_047180 [Liparis tanakae]|uniref:Secreted protein n=1 Tax=Liparis tanakae TaxID=230148 RepID=A0A4Z2FNZ7_9TELE|nr:hypothetical protein EYF80_047180 [Liparis tanakae]